MFISLLDTSFLASFKQYSRNFFTQYPGSVVNKIADDGDRVSWLFLIFFQLLLVSWVQNYSLLN